MNITVDINKKHINTEPLNGVLVQGETLVDSPVIKLPLLYGAVDLSALNYAIRATNEESEVTASLVLTKTVTDDSVDLVWPISATFTAASGLYLPVLEGTDDEGDIVIKLVGDAYSVRRDPTLQGFSGITPSLLSQFIAQAYALIAGINVVKILGIYATLEALTAGVETPQIGDIYAVGAGEPYTGYVWVGSWTSLGPVRGQQGLPGADGTDGVDGVGVPSGGTDNQVVAKDGATEFVTKWLTITAEFVGAVAIAAATYTEEQKAQIRANINAGRAVDGTQDYTEAYAPVNYYTDSRVADVTDLGCVAEINNAAAKTFTLQPQSSVAWPAKANGYVRRSGAGAVEIVGGAGVTFQCPGGRKKIAEQYNLIYYYRISENLWGLVGVFVA